MVPRISSICRAAHLTSIYALHLPLSSNLTRDLSSTLHYRRLISYDDRLVAHTMPMLIKSMTCIFPPFPLLFVFLPYIPFFFSRFLHPPMCVPTYLRLYFVPVLALQPSLSHLILCHIHVYIPFPPNLPPPHPSPSNCRRALEPTIPILISPFSHSHSTPSTSSPVSLATKSKRIYSSDMLFFYLTFLIRT